MIMWLPFKPCIIFVSFVFGREVRHLGSPLPVNFTPSAVHRTRPFATSFATARMSDWARRCVDISGPIARTRSPPRCLIQSPTGPRDHSLAVSFLSRFAPPASDLLLFAKDLLFVAIVAIEAAPSGHPTSLKGTRGCGTITAAMAWPPEQCPTQRQQRSRQSAQRPSQAPRR